MEFELIYNNIVVKRISLSCKIIRFLLNVFTRSRFVVIYALPQKNTYT